MKENRILTMYDIRGIQDYVFKTNKIREIVGASKIIDEILINALHAFSMTKEDVEEYYLWNWKNEDSKYDEENEKVMMQTIYVGGGNAYVLYHEDIYQEANKFVSKYVLDNTYSLRLAIANVDADDFGEAYENVNSEMFTVKAKMPCSIPVGAFSFTKIDSITGYPLSKISAIDGACVCKETYLKEIAFKSVPNENKNTFDSMGLKKGDDSTLALVCLDGNNIGERILKKFKNLETYKSSFKHMRNLSKGIDKAFKNAFNVMEKGINNQKLYRKIILAGDDICFVCNPRVVMNAVENFLEELSKQDCSFMADPSIPFTACAGIAFFNSHFPFSDAYKVAIACCDNAKKTAKSEKFYKCDPVGSFVDFQICTNVNASDLDAYRDKHYIVDGESFINRPYYVELNTGNRSNTDAIDDVNKQSINNLNEKIDILNNLPRNVAKEIRAAIVNGDNEIEKEISYLNSRGIYLNTNTKNSNNNITLKEEKAVWYDACELMDFYSSKENGENENN